MCFPRREDRGGIAIAAGCGRTPAQRWCTSVILETAVDNRAALAFYKTHEYNVMRTIPRYYSDGVDALVLKKNLISLSEAAKLPQ